MQLSRKMRQWVIAVLVVGLLLGLASWALAQEPAKADKQPLREVFWNQMAKNLNIDPGVVQQAAKDAVKQTLQQAVEEGRIKQQVADKIGLRVDEKGIWFPERIIPKHAPKPPKNVKPPVNLITPAMVAQALGMTPEELKAARQSGQNLQQIIAAQGATLETIKANLLLQVETKLAEAVSKGRLKQEQADKLLERLSQLTPEQLLRHAQAGPRQAPEKMKPQVRKAPPFKQGRVKESA